MLWLRIYETLNPPLTFMRNWHLIVTWKNYVTIPLTLAMALPLAPGLTPAEVAFLCEMELITIVPRQRLEELNLLGVCGFMEGACTDGAYRF
jgi:hypothetical protein